MKRPRKPRGGRLHIMLRCAEQYGGARGLCLVELYARCRAHGLGDVRKQDLFETRKVLEAAGSLIRLNPWTWAAGSCVLAKQIATRHRA
jgi:hypothetical protein